jgi:hypothetical protein
MGMVASGEWQEKKFEERSRSLPPRLGMTPSRGRRLKAEVEKGETRN